MKKQETKKNICFITGFFPSSIYNHIIEQSKYNPQNAADKLQKSFLEGLIFYYPDLYVLNAPFVGSFPIRYKKMFIPSSLLDGVKGKSIGYMNLMGLKHFIIKFKLLNELKKWINSLDGEKYLIVYSLQSYLMKTLVKIKKDYPDLKIVLIIPDLVQYMGGPSGVLYKMMRKMDVTYINSKIIIADGYIILTKHMKDVLPAKPYNIVEGISNSSFVTQNIEKYDIKTVLYSGSLASRHGILKLVDAFLLLKIKDTQLIICGSGECENTIRNVCTKNSNIIYKGTLKQSEVFELQKKAYLLVNPRTPEGEYTKYSFPSKTIEYFQSGTPVLLYKLPGIPDEYFNYCFSIEDDYTVENMAYNIRKILNMDQKEIQLIGEKAKEFVEKSKNSITQCVKIVNLIETL